MATRREYARRVGWNLSGARSGSATGNPCATALSGAKGAPKHSVVLADMLVQLLR